MQIHDVGAPDPKPQAETNYTQPHHQPADPNQQRRQLDGVKNCHGVCSAPA